MAKSVPVTYGKGETSKPTESQLHPGGLFYLMKIQGN